MSNQYDNALGHAGTALLHAARLQSQMAKKSGQPQLNDTGYRALLAAVRRSLEKANPSDDTHRYFAVKSALEALEAFERGESTLGGIEQFKSHVGSSDGGERPFDFGGKKVKHRLSVNDAFLRAAAFVLWQRDFDRDQLVKDVGQILGITSRQKFRAFVNNVKTASPDASGLPVSSIWVHVPRVTELIDTWNYRALTDFA